MTLHDDYTGPFDPGRTLEGFSRQALADRGREFLLAGHLQDRVGLPLVMGRFGDEAMTEVSIEEWMAASPIYSERVQKAMGFVGDTVETVFKNIQLDIGAPHQFMDFAYRLDRPDYREFWLAYCGALMDVEPFGEERVFSMCHTVEDPTFDATAAAANPRMRIRPIHRPPRVPAHRMPHCRWKVFIDEEATPFEQHEILAINRASKAARVSIERPSNDAEPGGWADYSGEFDPHCQLEDFSHSMLVVALEEVALQSHLLARALSLSVTRRWTEKDARAIALGQWIGIAALTAERLRDALGIGDDLESIAKIFQIHPCFRPRAYVDLRVELASPERLRVSIGDCPALAESDHHSWFSSLDEEPHPALSAIAGAIHPQARCRSVPPSDGVRYAWEIEIDPGGPAWKPTPEVALAKITKGATWHFERRRLPRGETGART